MRRGRKYDAESTAEQMAADQLEQRRRRRTRMRVRLGAEWDLLAEVHDIISPLGERLAAEPIPAIYRADVDELRVSVHALVGVIFDMVTASDCRHATRHLPARDRARAAKLLATLAERPAAVPEISDEQLASGNWVEALSEHVGPFSGRLADLLAKAKPPDDAALRGSPSVSERVVNALRVIDLAATSLDQHLYRSEFFRKASRRNLTGTKTGINTTEHARAELARMGVEL